MTSAPERFDAVIVGSGFGGAVAAARLSEAGLRVLVLERGRAWQPKDYPRGPTDPWIFDHHRPHRHNGWIDMRFHRNMAVVQGAGVGGGSLIYANVSVEARPEAFASGWPAGVTYEALKPHYDEVGRMLNVHTLPAGQETQRYKLVKEAAHAIGAGPRFQPLPIAVTFDPAWRPDLPDAHDLKHSKRWTNAQGVEQGTCVHCGECDIGCKAGAKNTLDLNYLAVARRHGAEVRPLHVVRGVAPDGEGYRVDFHRIEGGQRVKGSVWGRRVVLAAGSLGSTEILLRARRGRQLPNLSPALGRNWTSNGDFLTPAIHKGRQVRPSDGPTITAAIDFLDGPPETKGQRFWVQDGGFPLVAHEYIRRRTRRFTRRKSRYRRLARHLGRHLRRGLDLHEVMPWFAQGIDAGDGRLYLGRLWYAPWRRVVKVHWRIGKSEPMFDALVAMHKRLARATGGEPWVPPTWEFGKDLVTPHPLGGCNMADDPAQGVVDAWGEVHGHPGLYVADGAIVPRPIGRNPSRTIAALAERISAGIVAAARQTTPVPPGLVRVGRPEPPIRPVAPVVPEPPARRAGGGHGG